MAPKGRAHGSSANRGRCDGRRPCPRRDCGGGITGCEEFDADVILVGDEARIRPLLRGPAAQRVRQIHAPDAVAMDLSPSIAVRSCERTSLGVAVTLSQARRGRRRRFGGEQRRFSWQSRSLSSGASKASRGRPSPPSGRRSTDRRFCSTPAPMWIASRNGWSSSRSWARRTRRAVLNVANPRVGILIGR